MTTLIIARHGNTFEKGETPRRVGGRTDLPLVESGRVQAARIGAYLKEHNVKPDAVFTSHLKRTIETADIALKTAGLSSEINRLDMLNEIDYGPDENKTESEVIARIGEDALLKWDQDAIVPQGWLADLEEITQNWRDFLQYIINPSSCDLFAGSIDPVPSHRMTTVLVVTSNGIARFLPDLINPDHNINIKLSTGALGILRYDGQQWKMISWNLRP